MGAMTHPEEIFDVVTPCGRVVGRARRRECHGNPALRHRVAHVLVCDPAGRLYLQKRSNSKDIQPGKWDTSVGGHLCPGETPEAAARRELAEELGITGPVPEHCYRYTLRTEVETELVDTYHLVWSGPVVPDPEEIEAGRWWTDAEVAAALGTGTFTPNFEEEYARWLAYRGRERTAGSR
jgi:isopentenyldiphosphate isomerase